MVFGNVSSSRCLAIYLLLISSLKVYLDHRSLSFISKLLVLPTSLASLCSRLQIFYVKDLFKYQVVEFLKKKLGRKTLQ